MPPRLQIRTPRFVLTHSYQRPTAAFQSPFYKSSLAATRLHQFTRQLSITKDTTMSQSSNTNDKFKISNLFDVKGRVALITGAGTGIGLMATQALAVNGAKVYICGRTQEKLDKVAELYGKDIEGSIIPVTADVSSKEDIKKLVDYISEREKCLCVLINNAGIALNTQETSAKTATEMSSNLFSDKEETFEMWTDTYRTNVPQLYFMTMAFLPLLEAATEHHKGYSGTVINISSISGIVKSSQHHFAYNASKAAAIHVTTMLASEIAENGIKVRVNSIAPGVFPSEMTAQESGDDQKSHIPKEKYEDKTAARRPGKDEDMGNAVLFMVTNQYLNGVTVPVDGGYILVAGSGAA